MPSSSRAAQVSILDPVTSTARNYSFPAAELPGRGPFISSRAEAIHRGQWELMEMVKKMPAASDDQPSYLDLSLKDLVEHPTPTVVVVVDQSRQDQSLTSKDHKETALLDRYLLHPAAINKSSSTGKMTPSRSRKVDERGLFLKTVFPFCMGSRKKCNLPAANKRAAKVSPKPAAAEKDEKSIKAAGSVSKDSFWTNKISSGSNSSNINGRSSNTCTTRMMGKSYLPRINFSKSKSSSA
ncbi:unnamed protein product [Cuscuta epithymum]|uniref:Uncharacterized protein n=1 Tax=Cuscuta epithymum TaxID=186058 RepID=A0AAV0EYU7_9ASTE|nr:unnamed protein product [Cuscuta epithymum]